MGLLTYFQRQRPSPDASTGAGAGVEPEVTADAVAQARARALRRLVGASLLLAVGVIGFPLLFETQPRPIRLDVPMALVRKDAAAPTAQTAPPALTAKPMALPSAEPVPEPVAEPIAVATSAPKPPAPMLTERAGDQGREVLVAAPTAASRSSTTAATATAASVAPAKPGTVPAPVAEAARARALLEGQTATPATTPATTPAADPVSTASAASRIVVQVGAYADADKLRDVRARVERLGLKTYTQVVDNDGQKKTRVRVGPFATRPEADKIAAKLRDAGLPVAVLTL